MQWTVLQALYSLGAPREALARWYAPIRAAEGRLKQGRSKQGSEARPNQEAAG